MEKEQENKLHTTDNAPRQMTGAELKSMLKSSIQFKSLGGMRCEELTLPAEDKRWWTDCKVGMFVHWGLYSVQGHGEWAKFNEQIPDGEYEKLADELAAEAFHPGEWVALAKEFGARCDGDAPPRRICSVGQPGKLGAVYEPGDRAAPGFCAGVRGCLQGGGAARRTLLFDDGLAFPGIF